ncbi:MAG: hypothetical protein ACI835_000980 [Planctomycetota bacterium]|jgi:hypothetical protein
MITRYSRHRVNQANRAECGSVMAMVMLVVIILSGLAMAMQVLAGSAYRSQRHGREQRQAFYLAEAGISRAVTSLIAADSGVVGSEAAPITWGSGSFWVEATDLGDGKTSLIAVAQVGMTREVVELITEANPEADTEPLFADFGLFGGNGVNLNSGERVRSYDSRLGGISDVADTSQAQVGSNDDIDMSAGSRVAGDAYSGPTGSVTVAGGASVSGMTYNAVSTRAMQPIASVPVIADLGPMSLAADQSLAAGDYHYSSLEIPSHTTLTIHGPADVVLDSLDINSGGTLAVDSSLGPVTFYCSGDFIVEGSVENLEHRATDIRFLIQTDTDVETVMLEHSGALEAVVHAPNADIVIDHAQRFLGAISARSLTFASGSRIYQDLAASNMYLLGDGVSMSPPPDYLVLSWRPISIEEKTSLDQGTHPHDIRGAYATAD